MEAVLEQLALASNLTGGVDYTGPSHNLSSYHPHDNASATIYEDAPYPDFSQVSQVGPLIPFIVTMLSWLV